MRSCSTDTPLSRQPGRRRALRGLRPSATLVLAGGLAAAVVPVVVAAAPAAAATPGSSLQVGVPLFLSAAPAAASFGNVPSVGAPPAGLPVVAAAATSSGHGYWVATAGGAVLAYGDAVFHGSASSLPLHEPIVGMAATPDGGGYWLVAADGGIFTYGDARFYGSAGSMALDQPIVGMAATPDGRGYWLVGADGGIFTYGDARFHGSLTAGNRTAPVTSPVTAMAATPDGGGYWEVQGSSLSASERAVRVASTSSASAPAGRSLGTFLVTCYAIHGTTASGAPASSESVAVDPSVIPLGTTIDIAGVGTRVADDTGGAIAGHRLDIWEPSAASCDQFGAQTLQVYLAS
ncbi:MAG: 3D domain-containing protein [Acidimicrobiales bacterium]